MRLAVLGERPGPARIHGRIRARADTAWMTFTGEQGNTYGPEPYVGPSATKRVKAQFSRDVAQAAR